MQQLSFSLVLFLSLGAGACRNSAAAPMPAPANAHLYAGFGDYHLQISTNSVSAQLWFDQGMQLLYGFNHDEAIRSFEGGAAQDPLAAMPWWGIAYANGVNLNDTHMDDERNRAAREAADEALARLAGASPLEAALVRAISARYAYPAPAQRRSLDLAYADAMQAVYRTFPSDPDVGALYADALMNLQPWDYWTNDGEPKGRIEEVLTTLEGVMAAHPEHPGANHFYIHAVEASQDPDRAEDAADRLIDLVPGSGHLVHMPSHIYVRVGRYSDAVDSNALAVQADEAYFERSPEPEIYALYYAHNLHFLAYAAMMSGRFEEALAAAHRLESHMPEASLRAFAPSIDGMMPTNFHVLIRFGQWGRILTEPDYPEYRLVSRAVRHYARSVAYSATGRTAEAHVELEAFETAIEAVPDNWRVYNNAVSEVLPIAYAMVRGELLYREGSFDEAFAVLREGIQAEDALIYDEPPGWMLPVRHALGALLMEQGRFGEAEAVYREDLERNRSNGWGLLGLKKALLAQGDELGAEALGAAIERAWAKADLRPQSSCYCAPGS